MKRAILFADLVMNDVQPEHAANLACLEHPDPCGSEDQRDGDNRR